MKKNVKNTFLACAIAGVFSVTGCASNIPANNDGNATGERLTNSIHRSYNDSIYDNGNDYGYANVNRRDGGVTRSIGRTMNKIGNSVSNTANRVVRGAKNKAAKAGDRLTNGANRATDNIVTRPKSANDGTVRKTAKQGAVRNQTVSGTIVNRNNNATNPANTSSNTANPVVDQNIGTNGANDINNKTGIDTTGANNKRIGNPVDIAFDGYAQPIGAPDANSTVLEGYDYR